MKDRPFTGYDLFEEHSYLSRKNARHVVKILKAANGADQYKILAVNEENEEVRDYWHLRFLDAQTARKKTAAHIAQFKRPEAALLQ
jgi:hypothetical protein